MSPAEQAKHDILVDIQLEALSKDRKERIVTTEFKDNRFFIPVNQLEGHRLVNEVGTAESKAVKGKEKALSGWNNIWMSIKDDGTADEDQADVGTGIGQTHRHKLLQDPSIKEYAGDHPVCGGNQAIKKAPRGSSGTFNLGIRSLSAQPFINDVCVGGHPVLTGRKVRFADNAPLTRKRVAKGSVTSDITTFSSARQGTSSISASNGVRKRAVVGSGINAEPVGNQARRYGKGLVLSSPDTFLAFTLSNRSEATSKPANNGAAADTKASVNAKPSTVSTGSGGCNVAQDKESHFAKASKTDADSTVEPHASDQFRAKVAAGMTARNGDQTLTSQPKEQPVPQTVSAASASELSAFLPALKGILPPEQYAIVEAMAGVQASFQPCSSSTQPSLPYPAVFEPPTSSATSLSADTAITKSVSTASTNTARPIARNGENVCTPKISGKENIVDKRLKLWFRKEDEGTIRCQVPNCGKVFKDEHFWRNHVETRHSEWLKGLQRSVISNPPGNLKGSFKKVTSDSTIAPDASKENIPFAKVEASPEVYTIIPKIDPNFQRIEAAANTAKTGYARLEYGHSEPSTASPVANYIASQTDSAAKIIAFPIATAKREGRRSLAENLARQREAIIGEHVYKARFQPASGLVERFKNLTINDAPKPTISQQPPSSPPKAACNPFGASKSASAHGICPTLPTFLQQAIEFKDPGAAAREQYSGAKVNEPISRSSQAMNPSMSVPKTTTFASLAGSAPSLPAFLQGVPTASDVGAAARRQYGGRDRC